MGKKTPPFEAYPEWTEAKFWGFIRSALRMAHTRWAPMHIAKKNAKTLYTGKGRNKFVYECAHCHKKFFDKETEVHHKIGVGKLNCFEDLPGFVKRLFCGVDGYEVVCKKCHNIIKPK